MDSKNMILVRSLFVLLIDLMLAEFARAAMSPEARLLSHWTKDLQYNPQVRPVLHPDSKITVRVRFALAGVKYLMEKDLTMTSVGWLHMVWKDEVVQWNPTEWSGTDRVIVPADRVWKPEINVRNSMEKSPDWGLGGDTRLVVYHDGVVDWRLGFLWYTSCKMNLRKFPFDTQRCDVQIASWTYNTSQVELVLLNHSVLLSAYEPNSEWELVGAEVAGVNSEQISILSMVLTLKRNPAYYVLNVLVPAMLVSFLTMLIFCLPHESGEKVALGMTVLLAFTVVMLTIVDVSPRGGDSIPIMSGFVVVNLILSGLCVALAVFTSMLYHQPATKPLPVYFKFLLREEKKLLNVKPTDLTHCEKFADHQKSQTGEFNTKHSPDEATETRGVVSNIISFLKEKQRAEETKELKEDNWHRVANALDRIFFWVVATCVVLSNVTMLSYVMSP